MRAMDLNCCDQAQKYTCLRQSHATYMKHENPQKNCKMQRICITGIGGISPLGNIKQTFVRIQQGESAIKRLELLKGLPCEIGGFVNLKTKKPKVIEMALLSAGDAIKDANLDLDSNQISREKIGVSCASGFGDLNEIEGSITRHYSDKRLSPFTIPNMLINMAGAQVAIGNNFQGPMLAQSTACAASLQAIIDGYNAIRNGDAEYMIAGGSEACMTRFAVDAFTRAKAITTKHNNSPELASRPFEEDRSGFVLSEGAAFVVLEKETTALQRKANIYGYIQGYGMSCDAHHITTPGNDGAYRCIQIALNRAKTPIVDFANCHATSTPIGDDVEKDAIMRLCPTATLVAYKRQLGHVLGSSGALELCLGLQTEFKYQLKNSFGFGGVNASIIVSKY